MTLYFAITVEDVRAWTWDTSVSISCPYEHDIGIDCIDKLVYLWSIVHLFIV